MAANTFTQSIKPWLAEFGVDAPDIAIDEVSLDSRDVAVHTAFAAVKGHQLDGRDFIPQAISLGARVIIAETEEQQEHGLLDMREQSVIIYFYQLRQRLSALAAKFYAYPSTKLDVIAVTGTNGKTSTVQLTSQLRALTGNRVGSVGTLGAMLIDPSGQAVDHQQGLNTTPDPISMQRLLAEFVAEQSVQVALEASSHALVQHRLADMKTDVAVFSNLSRDHLDYHGSMAEYARAKRLLLQQQGLKYAIINGDDPESRQWLAALPENVKAVIFSMQDNQSERFVDQQYCVATDIRYHAGGCELKVVSSWGNCEIHSPLIGPFNVANLLAALCTQLVLGQSLPTLAQVCPQLRPVPGRMELYANATGASIAVDYAHTPDALQKALVAVRAHSEGSIWCVFGCGGDRDQGKRPLMGEIAEQYADRTVITNDNSRNEAPQAIAKDILNGCREPQRVHIELDRKQAITYALEQAQQGDVILVAGKGHEDYQIIGDQRLPYNERLFVENLLKGKGND